jgi:hypothetical protein
MKKSQSASAKARLRFLFSGEIEKLASILKLPILGILDCSSYGKGRINPRSAEQTFFTFSRELQTS